MFLPILALIILADQASKYLTVYHLASMSSISPSHSGGEIELFNNFLGIDGALTYVANYGAIWGIFSSWPALLVIFRICLITGLIIGLFFYKPAKKTLLLAAIFIIAGAISNVIDYFIYGHVVDMIKLTLWGYNYPVFNIADSSICIGIFIFIVDSIQNHFSPHENQNSNHPTQV